MRSSSSHVNARQEAEAAPQDPYHCHCCSSSDEHHLLAQDLDIDCSSSSDPSSSSSSSLSARSGFNHHRNRNGSNSPLNHHHLPVLLHDDMKKCSAKSRAHMSDLDLMKERFARLLLGEDMSGGAKGVTSALAISNAITGLAASVFGEVWRLQPLSAEQKAIWKREMEWLLAVANYVVEFVPSWQSTPDGSGDLEVMVSRPRADLEVNLPALRKLDAMFVETLQKFDDVPNEFWYADREEDNSDGEEGSKPSLDFLRSSSSCKQRRREKWWLPSPRVPLAGLSDDTVKHLHAQRECIRQIRKAALSINNQTLSDMEVPRLYSESLPKTARACLGEQLYKQMTSQAFCVEALVTEAVEGGREEEVMNRAEAAIQVWRSSRRRQRWRRRRGKNAESRYAMSSADYEYDHYHGHHHHNSCYCAKATAQSRSSFDAMASWALVRDFVLPDANLLASRAHSLLLALRHSLPSVPQSLLHRLKIHNNQDVGQSILESYSRAIESLAGTIISRIDDVLLVHSTTKGSLTDASTHRVPAAVHYYCTYAV